MQVQLNKQLISSRLKNVYDGWRVRFQPSMQVEWSMSVVSFLECESK
jgi:hypothetical protein